MPVRTSGSKTTRIDDQDLPGSPAVQATPRSKSTSTKPPAQATAAEVLAREQFTTESISLFSLFEERFKSELHSSELHSKSGPSIGQKRRGELTYYVERCKTEICPQYEHDHLDGNNAATELHTTMRKLFALHLEEFRLKTAGIVRRPNGKLGTRVSGWKISSSTWESIAETVIIEERKVWNEDRRGRMGLDWTPVLDEISDGAKLLGFSNDELLFMVLTYGGAAYNLADLVREQNFDLVVLYLLNCTAFAAKAPGGRGIRNECLQALRKFSKRYFKWYGWVDKSTSRAYGVMLPGIDERRYRFQSERIRRSELVRLGEAVLKREEELDWLEQVDREEDLEKEERKLMWELYKIQRDMIEEDEEEYMDA